MNATVPHRTGSPTPVDHMTRAVAAPTSAFMMSIGVEKGPPIGMEKGPQDAHLVAGPPVVVARSYKSRAGLNAGFADHSAVHSKAGSAHGVAEAVTLPGDPIAVFRHLLTEIFQIVPTRVRGPGRIRVAPSRGKARRFRLGSRSAASSGPLTARQRQ